MADECHSAMSSSQGQGLTCQGTDCFHIHERGSLRGSCQGSCQHCIIHGCWLGSLVPLLGLLIHCRAAQEGIQDAVVLQVMVQGCCRCQYAGVDRCDAAICLLETGFSCHRGSLRAGQAAAMLSWILADKYFQVHGNCALDYRALQVDR